MSTALAAGGFVPLTEARRKRPAAPFWGSIFILTVTLGWMASPVIGFERSLMALMFFGLATAVLGLFKPIPGLFGIGLLCTLDAIARSLLLRGGALRWNTLNYWLLIMMVVGLLLLLRFRSVPVRLLYAFIGLMGVQFIFTSSLSEGLQHVLGVFIVGGLVIYFLRAAKTPEIWIWLGLANGVAAAMAGLFYNLLKSSLPYVNPNAASYLPLTGLFSICLAFPFARGRRRMQLLLLTLGVVNAGWVFLTGSRGGMLISICCLLFLLKENRHFGHILVLGAVGVVFAAVISTRFGDMENYSVGRITRLFDQSASIQSRTSGRSDLAQVGLKIFMEHPFGVGTGSFRAAYAKYSHKENVVFKAGHEVDAHAGWVKILAENGILGVLLFGTFVLSFAWCGWQRRREGLLPIGLLVTSVLGLAFLSTEFQGKGLWFLVAGSALILAQGFAAGKPKRKKKAVESDGAAPRGGRGDGAGPTFRGRVQPAGALHAGE